MITVKNIFRSTLMLISVLVLTSCASTDTDEMDLQPASDPAAMGQEESLVSQTIGIMEGRTTGPMLPVYFDFDSYSVTGGQIPRMTVNADFLKDHTNVKIRIEGNCDPRGTREYNLALGEKRALVAQKYLENMGISPDRMSTVSLGEEKMLLTGHDELSWAQNRRDDFVVE
jgi:peptidoglycan-associated lipoprotein